MTFPNEKTPAAASQSAAAPADAAAAHSKTGAGAPAACAGCVHDDPHVDRTSTPCTTATRRLADVSRTFNQWLTYGQAAALIAIAVAAIGGIDNVKEEIWETPAGRHELGHYRDVTLVSLRIMDAVRQQAGIAFPADSNKQA